MTNSKLFKKAHEMTKEILKSGDNYQATFGLVLSFLYAKGEVEMKGSKKQIAWAKDIKEEMLSALAFIEEAIGTFDASKARKNAVEQALASVENTRDYVESLDDAHDIIEKFQVFTDNEKVYNVHEAYQLSKSLGNKISKPVVKHIAQLASNL